jgi:hypothetical protein
VTSLPAAHVTGGVGAGAATQRARCSAMSISTPAALGSPSGLPIVGDCSQNDDHWPGELSKRTRASK